jgi:prevent-host-death family protein
METVVTLKEMKHRLSELLERAAQGERVVIHQQGKPPLALMRVDALQQDGEPPVQSPATKRQLLERAAAKLGPRFHLPPTQRKRLAMLGQKNKRGTLTEEERAELEQLLRTLEEISRQRAQALSKLL